MTREKQALHPASEKVKKRVWGQAALPWLVRTSWNGSSWTGLEGSNWNHSLQMRQIVPHQPSCLLWKNDWSCGCHLP